MRSHFPFTSWLNDQRYSRISACRRQVIVSSPLCHRWKLSSDNSETSKPSFDYLSAGRPVLRLRLRARRLFCLFRYALLPPLVLFDRLLREWLQRNATRLFERALRSAVLLFWWLLLLAWRYSVDLFGNILFLTLWDRLRSRKFLDLLRLSCECTGFIRLLHLPGAIFSSSSPESILLSCLEVRLLRILDLETSMSCNFLK